MEEKEIRKGSRIRAQSLGCMSTSTAQHTRRRVSRTLDDSQIFTISENTPEKVSIVNIRQQIETKKPKLVKRQRSRVFTTRVPDITNFPLLVTTAGELLAASKRTRAMSAPAKAEHKTSTDSHGK